MLNLLKVKIHWIEVTEDEDYEVCEVYDGCEFSVEEAVLDLMTDCIKNRGSRKSLSDHLKTF